MLHLVTGGSGSGKSKYAEKLIMDMGPAPRLYIATMHPYDDESRERIRRHREMRADKEFETVECYKDLMNLRIPDDCNVLLECISNLLANEMFDKGASGIHAIDAVLQGVRNLVNNAKNVVIVTNEIGTDGISDSESVHIYQAYLGAINQEIGYIADTVTQVMFGIPIPIKTEKQTEEEGE